MYTQAVLDLILLMVPVTIVVALFLWRLYVHDWRRDTRIPRPLLRLSLVLAIEATITAIGSSYLGVATVLVRSGHPLPADWAPVSVTIILALELPPALSAGYLLWLNKRRDQAFGRED